MPEKIRGGIDMSLLQFAFPAFDVVLSIVFYAWIQVKIIDRRKEMKEFILKYEWNDDSSSK